MKLFSHYLLDSYRHITIGSNGYLIILLLLVCPLSQAQTPSTQVILGAERLTQYLPLLANKRVGLIVNQTSQVQDMHLLDILLKNEVNVRVLFAPEHGVRGNAGAGEHIDSGIDALTGVAIQSIYGKDKTPPDALMQTLDVILFDIQDVGTRFYTYISSMHYMMEAAAKHQVDFIVLDRPNPNGMYVDGPVLEMAFQSFVGMHQIPVLHGLTVAELALMIKGEKWIENAEKLRLTVIPMQAYNKAMRYSLPIPPSPNLPNDIAIELYPSLCFFEASAVSVGRGTDFPFQQIGHHQVKLGKHTFRPESRPFAAPNPKLEGQTLYGIDMRNSGLKGLSLQPLINAYRQFRLANNEQGFFTAADFMDKLAGTDTLRLAIQAGVPEDQIRESWQTGLQAYVRMREPYLLYPLTPSI
ncbi:exo-beta-N-acetylmuramidase NamZ domain-containing protein [Glaciecola sp. SC05]|uniref:exo-beta-N-acetylmuramidase NamZ family protein n=1 Tax=Glaciecola sp. SC05 TaxID=1987355 RepID=UPI003526F4F0